MIFGRKCKKKKIVDQNKRLQNLNQIKEFHLKFNLLLQKLKNRIFNLFKTMKCTLFLLFSSINQEKVKSSSPLLDLDNSET